MILDDVGFIAADTSRTRVYLQALFENRLMPKRVLILRNVSEKSTPGQTGFAEVESNSKEEILKASEDPGQSQTKSLEEIVQGYEIDYQIMPSQDINDSKVVSIVATLSESVLIYSGFGGVILRKDILETGKRFLHVHGGYLPKYKGSTTNYFSLLGERCLGASAIFLTSEIDSGPILARQRSLPPKDRSLIDHHYDASIRAEVLVNVLIAYSQRREWCPVDSRSEKGDLYYVIHPVLKHLAILSKR